MPRPELRAPDASAARLVVEPVARDPGRGPTAACRGPLLLLPPLVLPRLLPLAAGLPGARRAEEVQRRDEAPVPHPELPPLRALHRDPGPADPLVGRDRGIQLPRALRHRARHGDHGHERRAAHGLHLQLPLGPVPGRRLSGFIPPRVPAVPAVGAVQSPQCPAQPLGLGEPRGRGAHRPLHPALRDGRHRGSAVDLMSLEGIERHDYDVLVVGAGGAGLRAAVEASAAGARTALICKSLLGKAHTVMAEGGIAAALGNVWKEDNWRVHFRDTMRGGKLLNNWRMAQLHAQEAPDRVLELEEWGALFDRTADGLILQRDFGGHRYARLAHVGDRTGLEMIRILQQHAVHKGIDVFMECNLQRLLTDGGKIAGAFGYWRGSGKFVLFGARAVVLATGGVGKAWKITSNSWEYTGDGMAMALDAGADLIDMEIVQFHPTAMILPPGLRRLLLTEGVPGDGGTLKNSQGKRFMFDYIPEFFPADTADNEREADAWYEDKKNNRRTPDLLPRDEVARAINNEVKAGRGTTHGGVYLDIASRRSPEYIKKRLPSMYHQFKELADVDITATAIEVGPTCHYIMGGVRVEPETAATTVPGLFAAGEVAGGLPRADRLGGDSLSDLPLFGRPGRAGAPPDRGRLNPRSLADPPNPPAA